MNKRELVQPCERPLTTTEVELLAGSLGRSFAAQELQAQIPLLMVVAESTSSWPILEFSVSGRRGLVKAGMNNVGDFQYKTAKGLLGFFVFERDGLLAGMECWSIDGQTEPDAWPSVEALLPLNADAKDLLTRPNTASSWG